MDLVYAVEQKFRPLASYVLKYCSKSLLLILPHCGTPSKWHAQALMLSPALPTDVVLVDWLTCSRPGCRLLCWCRSVCVVLLFELINGAKWRTYATWSWMGICLVLSLACVCREAVTSMKLQYKILNQKQEGSFIVRTCILSSYHSLSFCFTQISATPYLLARVPTHFHTL